MDKVAADVHESAAAAVDLVADVGGINVEIAEESRDGAEFADAALVEQFEQAQPLRKTPDHKGFADLDSGTVADGEQRLSFRDREAERLLAKHMLAGFRGLGSPRDVKLIGQRIVDRVDIRVGEKFLVGAEGFRNVKRLRCLL